MKVVFKLVVTEPHIEFEQKWFCLLPFTVSTIDTEIPLLKFLLLYA